jgi:hypothetical protein
VKETRGGGEYRGVNVYGGVRKGSPEQQTAIAGHEYLTGYNHSFSEPGSADEHAGQGPFHCVLWLVDRRENLLACPCQLSHMLLLPIGCDNLLTNSGNWPIPQVNHQFCGVDQYLNFLTNTTVGICLAYYLPITVLSTN